MRLILQFLKKPWREKLFLLEALFFLSLMKAVLSIFPFKSVSKLLGRHMIESNRSPLMQNSKLVQVDAVVRSIKVMSRHLPFECKCLVQAAAAKMMLKLRRVEATVYLGVAKKEGFTAHAWLRVGDTVVLGGRGISEHAVVSYFT